jgi:DNA-binding MarR family transcriptional regulator
MDRIELSDREIEILQYIHTSTNVVKQRDLAKIIGISLGMTNVILKRLARKGWLMIRKVNNRNIQYIVSATGMEIITKRSYRYFKRTIKNVVLYREAIRSLLHDVKNKGYTGIVLVGESDISFIIEHLCSKVQLGFMNSEKSIKIESYYILFSENYVPPDPYNRSEINNGENVAYLGNILLNITG